MAEVIAGAFEPSAIQATYSAYASLLEPYASTEAAPYTFLNGAGDFQSAIATLQAHAAARAAAVSSYLTP